MNMMLAKKLLDLDLHELTSLLLKLEMSDRDAYNTLKELIEDL
mgnify:CR=1 FL=1